jgi:hypothetical protein
MKPMRHYYSLVLTATFFGFIFSGSISTAQNTRGIVIDKISKKPVAGVSVYINETGIGTTTNEKGEFNFKYFTQINENDTLTFSSIGYVTRKVALPEIKKSSYVVLLSENSHLLEGVTITSEKPLNLQIAYTKLSALRNGLFSYGSVLAEDKIWVIGGDESNEDGRGYKSIDFVGNNVKMNSHFSWQNYSDKLHVYDIQTDTWITSSLKFSKRAYHSINYYNNKIYVLGGKTLSTNRKLEFLDDKIEVFDIKGNTILVDKANPHQAVNFASLVYNGNLIVLGGSTRIKINEEKECSAKVHLLNIKTGLWYELNDMPYARETKGVIVDDIIYLIGGFNLKPLDNIETYNIITGEWNIVGHLFYEVERPAVVYHNNIIYIFEDGRIQTYNTDSKQLNMYSIELPLKFCDMFYSNDKLYLFGGWMKYDVANDESFIIPSPDLYSIDLHEFSDAVIYGTKKF